VDGAGLGGGLCSCHHVAHDDPARCPLARRDVDHGARSVVIVAPREWTEGRVVVRDMVARTESTVEAGAVHGALEAALSSGTRE